uniref:Glycosyltransferase n=1 Tax=Ignisphaera aggregans TaxID=334771 RepID=A0A7C5USM1_9CREN
MKAIVAHDNWARGGGGEFVSAYVVKTLLQAGHTVAIVALHKFDVEKIGQLFGIDISSVKVYSLSYRLLPLFGLYQKLLFFIPLQKAIKQFKPDIVFIDCERYKQILKLKKKFRFKLLEYIHFPFHASMIERGIVPKEYRDVLENYSPAIDIEKNKYRKGFWRYYYRLWLRLYDAVARGNPFDSADIVMTNSCFTAKLIKLLWGGEPVVLYPPVRVRDFDSYGLKSFEDRDNSVVMVGRISPEKRIEDVIDAIALSSTKPMLRIVGTLIPRLRWYKEFLEDRARKRGINIEFYINVPREYMVKIISSSRVFVHATRCEHFGIAVVEAMAGGCPVIVHKCGGSYEDIINRGEYGLYYESIEDLAENIDRLLSSRSIWEYYHRKSLTRAQQFDEKVFTQKFLEILKKIG